MHTASAPIVPAAIEPRAGIEPPAIEPAGPSPGRHRVVPPGLLPGGSPGVPAASGEQEGYSSGEYHLSAPIEPSGTPHDPAASVVDILPPASSVLVATDTEAIRGRTPTLQDRLLRQHVRRRKLRAMEKHAGYLADAMEAAARQLRRSCPVHPPIERLIPPGGVTRFAASLRDLAVLTRHEDDMLDLELARRDRQARNAVATTT